MLQAHYRSLLIFLMMLSLPEKGYKRLMEAVATLKQLNAHSTIDMTQQSCYDAMNDDFTPL
jgi:hypothetical protein